MSLFPARRSPAANAAEMDFPLWGKTWPNLEVAGVAYRKDAILRLLGDDIPEAGLRLEVVAELRPEPGNKHDRNAIAVYVGATHVGYLPATDAPRYGAIIGGLCASGYRPTVAGQVYANSWPSYEIDARGNEKVEMRLSVDIRLALDEPHLISPVNLEPDVAHVMLPQAHSVQVSGSANHLDVLAPVATVEGACWTYVTLHRLTEQLARSQREVVEVRLDGQRVGQFTPKMSEQFLPTVDLLARRGRATGARALLKGNRLKVDVTVHAARAQDLTAEWVAEHESAAPLPPRPVESQRVAEPAAAEPDPPRPASVSLPVVAPTSRAPLADSSRNVPRIAKGVNGPVPSETLRVVVRSAGTPAVDTTALLLASGKVRSDDDLVFYNQPRHPSGAVRHLGPAGASDVLEVDLDGVDADVETVVITASADGRPFRDVAGLSLEVQQLDGSVVWRFEPLGADAETAFVLGELYRRAGGWKFRAVGQGYSSGLAGLATDFGVEVA